MNNHTIRKLKNKFILISTLSFTIVMFFIAGCMYAANAWIMHSESRRVLDFIADNDGEIPDYEKSELHVQPENASEKSGLNIGGSEIPRTVLRRSFNEQFSDALEQFFAIDSNYASPEFAYSTRYFAVIFGKDGSASDVKTGHIAAVNRSEAVELARIARNSKKDIGRFGDYYYENRVREDGSSLVVILDCTDNVATTRRLLNLSLALIGTGVIISGIVMRLIAGRAVKNEVRNMENQKAFITNASHELKTPLAVIKANTEILEMTGGENEWTQSTMRQVDRMTGLIQNLVMITRAQERDDKQNRVETDISKAVQETVHTFAPVASQDGKTIEAEIPDGLFMSAEEGQIRQLVSLLVDNAIKYCDAGGTIRVALSRKGRSGIRLAVSNNYAAGKDVDYSRFFERFYREDKSHNQDKGGYGIGLSIAENLVEQYHGSIRAEYHDDVISFVCMLY